MDHDWRDGRTYPNPSNIYKEQLLAKPVSTSVMLYLWQHVSQVCPSPNNNVLSFAFTTTTNCVRCVEKSAAVSVVVVPPLIRRSHVYKTLTDRREPT